MVKVEMKIASASSGEHNDKKSCGRIVPARLFTAAVISGVLIALAAISWFVLYIVNVNVGD
jgi:hypothetical protein